MTERERVEVYFEVMNKENPRFKKAQIVIY